MTGVLHMDEKRLHFHAMVVPIVTEERKCKSREGENVVSVAVREWMADNKGKSPILLWTLSFVSDDV